VSDEQLLRKDRRRGRETNARLVSRKVLGDEEEEQKHGGSEKFEL